MFNKKIIVRLLLAVLFFSLLGNGNLVLAQDNPSQDPYDPYQRFRVRDQFLQENNARGLRADLKIIKVKSFPEKPTTNDKIQLVVTIKNDGYQDAKNFVINAENETAWKAKTARVKLLKAGKTKTVNLAMPSYNKDWLYEYNPHNFEIYVDSTNKVKEKLENNNFANYSLIIDDPNQAKPDLTVSNIYFDDQAYLWVEIQNIGKGFVPKGKGKIDIMSIDINLAELPDQSFLNPGGKTLIETKLRIGGGVNQMISATAYIDLNQEIVEENKLNNKGIIIVNPPASPFAQNGPDFIISFPELRFNEGNISKVMIKNIGNQKSQDKLKMLMTINIDDNDNKIIKKFEFDLPAMNIDQEMEFPLNTTINVDMETNSLEASFNFENFDDINTNNNFIDWIPAEPEK